MGQRGTGWAKEELGLVCGLGLAGAHRSWAGGVTWAASALGRARRGMGADWRPRLGRKKGEVPTGPEVKRRGEGVGPRNLKWVFHFCLNSKE